MTALCRAVLNFRGRREGKETRTCWRDIICKIWSWTPCACQELRSRRSQRPNGKKNISHRSLQLSHSEQSSLCIVKPETPKGCMEIIQTVLQNIICPLRGHTSLGNRRLKSNRERKQNDNRNHTWYLRLCECGLFTVEKLDGFAYLKALCVPRLCIEMNLPCWTF